MAIVINTDNFEDIIKKGVVLVDFWAEWCWPCQAMLPVLDKLSNDMKWKVIVWKVNVDEYPKLATDYKVMSIPTFIVFKDGEMVDQIVWVKELKELKDICWMYL